MAAPTNRRRNAATVLLLATVVAGMAGLSFASAPLYRLFCAATGFGGTTQRAAAAPKEVADTLITVRFNAETAPDLGWEFRPVVPEMQVHPGEEREVLFRAVNRGSEAVSGTATYNVTPTKAGIYFDKLQCFCFTEQLLAPGESRDMGVVFFVDPDVLRDPGTRELRTMTLSYTMFRVPEAGAPSPSSGASSGPRSPTQAATQAAN